MRPTSCLLAVITALVFSANMAFSEIRIGVSTALSGPLAEFGARMRNGILLAEAEQEATPRITFIFADDSFDPKKTISNVKKLISEDRVSGLILFGSACSMAVADTIERAQVPSISLSTFDKVQQGRRYMTRLMLSAAAEIGVMVPYIKRQGYKTLAIAATTQDGMLALRDAMVASGAATVVFSEDVPPDERDFRSLALRLNSKSPSAVYNVLLPPQGGIFAKQLREAGYKGPILGPSTIENPQQFQFAADALEGVVFSGLDFEASPELVTAYKNRFNDIPLYSSAYGYDAAKLMINAAMSGDINKYLHSVKDFKGLGGTFSALPDNSYSIMGVLNLVENGTFRRLE